MQCRWLMVVVLLGACSGALPGKARCGDGTLQTSEECEGLDLRSNTCVSRGFTAGELKCSSSCTFDDYMCSTCGDGQVTGSEVCDGTDFKGATCESQGKPPGALHCAADCKAVDSTQCGINIDALMARAELCGYAVPVPVCAGASTLSSGPLYHGVLRARLTARVRTEAAEACLNALTCAEFQLTSLAVADCWWGGPAPTYDNACVTACSTAFDACGPCIEAGVQACEAQRASCFDACPCSANCP